MFVFKRSAAAVLLPLLLLVAVVSWSSRPAGNAAAPADRVADMRASTAPITAQARIPRGDGD